MSRMFREPQGARVGGEAVRCNVSRSYEAGDDLEVVHAPGGEAPQILPRFVTGFLWSCDSFRTIDEHLGEYLSDVEHPGTQAEALRRWIPRCRETGLLIGRAEVEALCRASHQETGGELSGLGFPTGGNPARLKRCVESFAANAGRHGRKPELMVSDDSRETALQQECRKALAAIARTYGLHVFHASPEDKHRYVELLIEQSRSARGAVEFGLFDVDRMGFACGANRNALLLHYAGRIFGSTDDDVFCHLARPPQASDSLGLVSDCDPFERWYFADFVSAREQAEMQDADYCGLHERVIGRDLGMLEGLETLDLSAAGPSSLARLREAPNRVRASFMGVYGDCGIPTTYLYLAHRKDNRRRLTESEERYRTALASPSTLVSARQWALSDAGMSPGASFALDHRELLPPFFPVLHAEDHAYGAALARCCRGLVAAHVPWLVEHNSGRVKRVLKPGDLHDEHRANVFEFAHFVNQVIMRWKPDVGEDATEERLRGLGCHFQRLGECSMSDYIEYIRTLVLATEGGKIRALERNLLEDPEAPDFWRADVEAYIAHTREALTQEDYDLPYDLKAGRSAPETRLLMRRLFVRYGQLLEAWPAMVRAARMLAMDGVRLGQRVDG